MKILSVAYPLLPVSPDSPGGAEQILALVDRGIVKAGHDSILIAAEGSCTRGRLIPTPAASDEITDDVRGAAQRLHLAAIRQALAEDSIDLIHFHGLDFYSYLPDTTVPSLGTLHLPPQWYPESIFSEPGLHLNCVSNTQAEASPSPEKLPIVSNGIQLENYHLGTKPRTHLLWLGRICPEKGVHTALNLAHRLELPLIVAGVVHPFRDHKAYFANQVQPLLDSKRVYIGPVNVSQKAALLAESICLLIPSTVAETSSLVAMEAAASGTPVVAFRYGALPEIVEHGVTGYIVDSEDQMLNAIREIGAISAERCRQTAQIGFDSARMVNDYLALYGRIISG